MFSLESSSLSWVRVARVDQRRNSRRDNGVVCRLALFNIGAGLDDTRLETGGSMDGTAGAAMRGIGGDGILAALPTPLGSLTELLRPPALPGPCGMPLTPASPAPCAKDGIGAARQLTNAKAKNDDLPNIGRASKYPTKGPAYRSWSRSRRGGGRRALLPGDRGLCRERHAQLGVLQISIDRRHVPQPLKNFIVISCGNFVPPIASLHIGHDLERGPVVGRFSSWLRRPT
jgi:hypothetical protein